MYDFKGRRLEGKMPNAKKKLIEAWIEIHKDELLASWAAVKQGEVIKIEGLK
ncbi:hypothetical protein FACS1894211_13990 [Clostridia bacterium]|nr:hypothetical protein FACS1894211_13990 [Clostridia bacterium]